MRKALFIMFLLGVAGISSCSKPPKTEIYNLHQYCRKEVTNPDVIAKIKSLGLEDKGGAGGDYSNFFEPKSRFDYKYLLIVLNPQTYKNIQSMHVKWNKNSGLTYEEIQQLTGLVLPKRGDKVMRADQGDVDETRYYVLGHENSKHPNLSQVTVTCAKNSYDLCWEVDIDCFGFVHPESD